VALLFFALSLLTAPAHAWSDHFRITREALSSLPELRDLEVLPTPFQTVINHQQQLFKAAGVEQKPTFNESLQIRKDFAFTFHAGERRGHAIQAIDVLATYSDEPDWRMDIELFDSNQYPELWRPEYTLMGGKVGLTSQAFRHMYWRSLDLSDPLPTFHFPPKTTFRAMGTAPERAELFLRLARAAGKIPGLEYWALRFMACSLHYLEDLSQPYHASPGPSPDFLVMTLLDPGHRADYKDLIPAIQNVFSYYHPAYEDYVALEMKRQEEGHGGADSAEIVASLGHAPTPDALKGLDYADRDIRRLVIEMAGKAVEHAADAGTASLDFFPPIRGRFVDLDPQAYMNEAWWAEVVRRGQINSRAKRAYFNTVESMFTLLGESLRRVIATELADPLGLFASTRRPL
jgi:hypothetical protein